MELKRVNLRCCKQEDKVIQSCSSLLLLQGAATSLSAHHLLQDVGDEVLGVSQLVLPLLRDNGSAVRPPRPQQGSERRPAVTVLTWNTNKTQ